LPLLAGGFDNRLEANAARDHDHRE